MPEPTDKTKRAKEIEDALRKPKAKADDGDDTARLLATLELLNTTMADGFAKLDAFEARPPGVPARTDNAGGPQGVVEPDPDKRHVELVEAQARADAVASAWGAQAPRPMDGESVLNYRRRLLQPHLRHSPQFKDLDLRKVGPETLGGIEAVVYSDSVKAAAHPTVPEGHLLERKRSDGKGHYISTFHGSPAVWMRAFAPTRRFVTSINPAATAGWPK